MRVSLLTLLCLLAASFSLAQPFNPRKRVAEARQRAAAVRAARVDALRQLGETIKGVRINSRTTVKDFITENDQVQAQFEGFLQGAQQEGKPNVYDDGTVEVKMVIYLNDVVNGLQKISRNNPGSVSPGSFNKMKRYAGRKFEATGTGAMNMEPSPPSNVDLWTYVSTRGRLMAKRAAQADAYRNMGETLYGVKIDSKTDVKDFVTQNDQIYASFQGVVRGIQFDRKVVYRPDGMVEITAHLNVSTLIDSLAQISRYRYRGRNPKFQPQSFENIRAYFPGDVITTTGVGAPPARYIGRSPRYRSIGSDPAYNRIEDKYTPDNSIVDNGNNNANNGNQNNWNNNGNDNANNGNQNDWNNNGNDDNTNNDNNNNGNQNNWNNNGNNNTNNDNNNNTNIPVEPTPPSISAPPAPPALGISPFARPPMPPLPRVPERFVPEWAKRYINATGTGVYPENMDVGQARAMARRAAQVDAYRVLAEEAMGVQLQGGTTVKDFTAESDIITARVNECYLRGAQPVANRDLRDEGAFEVDMKLYLGDMWEIIDAEYNKGLIGKYGKKLEGFRPDQRKYQGEIERYQSQLEDYRSKYQAYQKQLDDYYAKNSAKLAQDFSVSRKYQGEYRKYLSESGNYKGQYQGNRKDLDKFKADLDQYMDQYRKYYGEYQRLYGAYGNEAEAALMPGPPITPDLYFSGPSAAGKFNLPKVPQRFVPKWADRYITATGTGAYRRDLSEGQAVAMAKRAAQVDAYRLLVENAMGVRLSSETKVSDFIAENDTLTARVKECFLRGAQVVGGRDVPADRYYEIDMKLYLGDMWEIIDAEYNKVLIEKYGKKLEDYQPDQKRYKNELEFYKGQLKNYKDRYIAFKNQLGTYYKKEKKHLTVNHPVSKKYMQYYKKAQRNLKKYRKDYKKYRQQVSDYQKDRERRQAEYERRLAEYRKMYGAYDSESKTALMPGPPVPPSLSFNGPSSLGQFNIPKPPERFVPEWAKRYITASGTGAYRKDLSEGQAVAMAKRAAQVDAYRLLVENAMGVRLTSETTVGDFLTKKDTMTARVKDSFLRGAQIIGGKDVPSRGYYEVEMKLYLGDMWEIIDAEYNKVLMEDYGKKLEDYQPDQLRFRTEMEVFRVQLKDYKDKYLAYQRQLQTYQSQYGSQLSQDYPVSRKLRSQYQKFQKDAQTYQSNYQKYEQDVEKYQKELQRRQVEYQRGQELYQKRYQAYKNEAEVALMPAPPAPPKFNFTVPSSSGAPNLPKPPERFVPEWAKRDITATGTGAYRKDLAIGQAMAMAKRAAQVDAYRLLVENAMGVHLSSETTVKDFLTQRDTMTARVKESFLRGAQVVGGKDVRARGYYEVDMKLYLGDMWEIIDAEYNKVLMEEYGKKLDEFQPDQARFRTEVEILQAQLRDYQKKYRRYQKQLQQYQNAYGSKLSTDYPVAKKYRKEYRKYENNMQNYRNKYRDYQDQVEKYQRKNQEQQADYQKNRQQYQERYTTYKDEAKVALIPAPPAPPKLHFQGPAKTGQLDLPKPPNRFVPKWADRYITATGTGSYPKNMPTPQAKLMAKRAAQVDAYRLLVENAMGVHLQSETAVKDFLTQKDRITAKVNDCFLRGAQVTGGRNHPQDRYYEVDMRLYLGDMWKIIDAEYNKVLMKQYGQKLEEFQPDQARYQTEYELYQAQLRNYHNISQGYEKKLEEYYAKYGNQIAKDYPVSKKYQAQFRKFQGKTQKYDNEYQKYRQDVENFQSKTQENIREYDRFQKQYRDNYNRYQREAQAKLEDDR